MGEALRRTHQVVEREEIRESFRDEALASWAEYQQGSQHLTGLETREWLRSWGDADGGDATARRE